MRFDCRFIPEDVQVRMSCSSTSNEASCARVLMNTLKQKKLESHGWKIGSVQEFLALTSDESIYIDMKFALSKCLGETRLKKKLSQQEVARVMQSSQSRIAKMEAGDPTVSIDLLIRSLLAIGVTPKIIGKVIS